MNPSRFYAVSVAEGKLFISTDGAATFTPQAFTLPGGLPQGSGRGGRGGRDRLYCTPGKEGDFWISNANGLYHSQDAGKTFVKIDGVSGVHALGFGKAAPRADFPAMYMAATVNGVEGVLRSDDTAKTWVRINDDQHQWGQIVLVMGDPKQYGRAYVGAAGRGIFYGDPPKK